MFDFFNNPIVQIINSISTVLWVCWLLSLIFGSFIGITPVAYRLGIALWKRKITIFGTVEATKAIKSPILRSKIFRETNIDERLPNDTEVDKHETIFIVDWATCKGNIDNIISTKKNLRAPLLIYTKERIPDPELERFNQFSNVILVNYLGRLLNDILTSLITTSFDGR